MAEYRNDGYVNTIDNSLTLSHQLLSCEYKTSKSLNGLGSSTYCRVKR